MQQPTGIILVYHLLLFITDVQLLNRPDRLPNGPVVKFDVKWHFRPEEQMLRAKESVAVLNAQRYQS